MKVSIQQTQLP